MQNRKTRLGFPHPLIRQLGSTKTWRPCEENCRIPYAYEQFHTEGDAIACPHLLRPSASILSKTRQKDNMEFTTLIVQPFGPCCREIPELPMLYVCPACKYPLSTQKALGPTPEGFCNVCRLPVQLSSLASNNFQRQVDTPVFDCPTSNAQIYTERFVFVIQVSQLINKAEQLFLICNNIKQLVEDDRDCELAFVLIDDRVSIVTCSPYEDGEQEEPVIMVITDPVQGLPVSNPYFSTARDSNQIYSVLDTIVTYSEQSSAKGMSRLTAGLELLASAFQNAKALVFTCLLDENSSDSLAERHSLQLTRRNNIEAISGRLNANNLGVYLFVFDFGSVQLLEHIAPLATRTGGAIEYYRSGNRHCKSLHYDLHTILYDPTYKDVTVKVLSNNKFVQTTISMGSVCHETSQLKLATMSPRSTFTINLHPGKKLAKSFKVLITVLYTTAGRRRIRCLQQTFGVTDRIEDAVCSTGDEALFFGVVRDSLADRQLNPRARLDKTLAKIRPFVRASSPSEVQNNSLSIPTNLKLTCFYLSSLLKSGLFGSYANIKPNESFFRTYSLSSLPLETLSKGLYMKLYRIDGQQNTADPPRNIKLEARKIEFDGIYLIDSGRFLYLIVGEDVSQERLLEVVGVSQVEEVDYLQHIPNTAHVLNHRLSTTVEMLRAANLNYYLQLKGINEGSADYQSLIVPALYSEDEHRRLLLDLTKH